MTWVTEGDVQPVRGDHPHATRWPELIEQVVPQRHEVDEVIRMQVADDNGVERARLDRSREPRKRALAQIEQEVGRGGPDEICGARRAWAIGVGGSGAEDAERELSFDSVMPRAYGDSRTEVGQSISRRCCEPYGRASEPADPKTCLARRRSRCGVRRRVRLSRIRHR